MLLQGIPGDEKRPFTIEVLPLTGLVRFYDSDFRRPVVTEDDFG
jgi:hypothetical protein